MKIKYFFLLFLLEILLSAKFIHAQDLKQLFQNFNNQNLIGVCNYGENGAFLIFQESNLFGQNEIKVKFIKDLNNISTDDAFQICHNGYSKKDEISYLVLESGLLLVTWIDYRNDKDGDLYAQLIDENGILWDSSGVPICTVKGKQSQLSLTSDTKENIYFTWTDFRDDIDGNIYAQKINLYAEMQWKENGVQILNLSGKQENPKIISDGKGGAYISWIDNSTKSSQVYLQRIDSTAKKNFGEFGKFISKPGISSYNVKLVEDKNGNAIIIWCSKEEYQKVLAQKINYNGFEKWSSGGKEICQIKFDQLDPSIYYDEKFFIILFKIKN
ncbi:MAG: hypothetical protein N3A61_05915, partial [Ignavibacteria bacterium]|nr:hypothetical protein [Ignavibacteria bacterium]